MSSPVTTARPVDSDALILRPGDDGYDDARSVFNGQIDRRPAIVARCTNAAGVASSIALARELGLEITVRGGGHGVSGSAVADGALLIDLSPMKKIEVDAAARRAIAGPGVTWGKLDAATQEVGLAVTGGRVSNTGIAGLTLGSGSGWLERKLGLTCDNLLSATLVTADGRTISVSDSEEPELFWGLKGGGGNFGVVTEFEFRLHEVGPIVAGGLLLFDRADSQQVLTRYRDFMASAPDEIGGGAALISAPSAPFEPRCRR